MLMISLIVSWSRIRERAWSRAFAFVFALCLCLLFVFAFVFVFTFVFAFVLVFDFVFAFGFALTLCLYLPLLLPWSTLIVGSRRKIERASSRADSTPSLVTPGPHLHQYLGHHCQDHIGADLDHDHHYHNHIGDRYDPHHHRHPHCTANYFIPLRHIYCNLFGSWWGCERGGEGGDGHDHGEGEGKKGWHKELHLKQQQR